MVWNTRREHASARCAAGEMSRYRPIITINTRASTARDKNGALCDREVVKLDLTKNTTPSHGTCDEIHAVVGRNQQDYSCSTGVVFDNTRMSSLKIGRAHV